MSGAAAPAEKSLFLLSAWGFLIGALLSIALTSGAAGSESRSYVLSSFTNAAYSTKGDCRDGIDPDQTEQYKLDLLALGMPLDKVQEVMAGYPGAATMAVLINRARVGGKPVNAYANPAAAIDPKLHLVTGRYAYGFNLDGNGADSPNSFEDPATRESGVDNQLFRVFGCHKNFRGPPGNATPPMFYGIEWTIIRTSFPAWVITLTGEDLSKDGPVTVSIDRSIDHVLLDVAGNTEAYTTFRIDPAPGSVNVFQGRLQNGVLTLTDHHDLHLVGDPVLLSALDLSQTHLRMTLKPNGELEGLIGGYQPWWEIFFPIGQAGDNFEENQGIDVPGLYYALKHLADADPDPATGENRRISVAWQFDAVPAFVAPAEGYSSLAPVASSKVASSGAAPDRTPVSSKASGATGSTAMAGPAPATDPTEAAGPALLRRLSPDQYRQTIADIFGSDITIGGRFAPEIRANGLLAVGAGSQSVTGDELEQYHAMAKTIATQVVDPLHRRVLVPCSPASARAADDRCARKFVGEVGELLYRRPLTRDESLAEIGIAHAAALQEKDFYAGLQQSLAQMLVSPQFLFRWSQVSGKSTERRYSTLDGYARASLLSFLLWNSAPDAALLDEAGRGELDSPKGLTRVVNRMLASARLDDGVRAFFSDMLQLSCAEDPCLDASLSKDTVIFPRFSPKVAADAREQTLRTLVDLLVTHNGDYRDVFTTTRTFLTPDLAAVYGVPLPRNAPNGEPSEWQPYVYPAGDPRAGILSEISFVALHSHPGQASATRRGRALRELILCQRVPDPPANVSFKFAFDTTNPKYPTARSRLTAHRANPVCAGCHKLTDPIGLAMENFNADGSLRIKENDVLIDTSGELDGSKFTGMDGLDQVVANGSAAPGCLVNRLAEYALGRAPAGDEIQWVAQLKRDFIAGHYRLPALLGEIATSDALYRVEWKGAPLHTAVASAAK